MNNFFIFVILCGGLLLTLPVILWRVKWSRVSWQAWVCYQVAVIHRLIFSRCVQNNKCTIPEFGPAVIVANHTSPVDPVLLWTKHFASFQQPHLRVIGYMMAREYYEFSCVIRWFCRAMESIPVARNGQDVRPVRQALQRLREGRLLGLFPEGRLNVTSPDRQLLAGDTGVAWLAVKAGVPVIPVFIHRAPRSDSIFKAFFVRARSSLTYGTPLDLSAWQGRHCTPEDLAEVTDLIMRSIAELGSIGYTAISAQGTSASKSSQS